MSDHIGGPPPPPPPPPGFDQPYSTPRGPVTPEPEPYYVASTTPYVPAAAPAAPASRGIQIGGMSAIVAVIAGLLGAIGGYFLVQRLFFDRDPPTPEQVTAAFAPVTGTTYQEPSAEAMAGLRSVVSAQPDADELIAHLDARALLVGPQPVGMVMIFSIDPDDMAGSYREDYLAGFQASAGTSLSTKDIAGTRTYVGEFPLGKVYTFLDSDGLVFVVVGQNAGLLERAVSTLVTANS